MLPGMTGGQRVLAARCVAASSAACLVATFIALAVLDHRFVATGRDDLRELTLSSLGFLLAMVVAALVGVILLVRQPEHPVGWLFAALSVSISAVGTGETYGLYGLRLHQGMPAAASAAALSSNGFVLWLMLVALVFSLTPTGRHLTPRWRRVARLMVASNVLWLVAKVLDPGPLEEPFTDVMNPWAVDGVDLSALRGPLALASNILILVVASSLIVRFRRSRGDERRQLLWMAVVAVPFPVLVVVAYVAASTDNTTILNLAGAGFVLPLPIGAGLAISRYHLYDVDRILSRALSYLLVSALLGATCAAVIVLVARAAGQAVSRSPTALVLATLAVAAAARPVYSAVQDAVDRRFARRRWDALHQVRAFVANPSQQGSIESVLRSALQDPSLRVAYEVGDGWVTEDGQPAEPGPQRVLRAGRTVAAVAYGSDPATTRAALHEAASELDNAGLRAAIAVQLEEVRASRTRIAQAQVEERQRIERDLHDGAQQRLLGTAAQLQAALLNGEEPRLRAALELGIAECRSAVLELRELANGLHPSALADGGLTAALEDLAARLPVTTDIRLPTRRYAPHVEATVWFVVCEAVSNAVKHASARSITVELAEQGDSLLVAVVDDGLGGAVADGRGLRGLADRVEAVGGSLGVADRPAGGTRVEAVLPCGS